MDSDSAAASVGRDAVLGCRASPYARPTSPKQAAIVPSATDSDVIGRETSIIFNAQPAISSVMECERCRSDTNVEKYEVDDFAGYLCDACRDEWDELQDG